MDTYAAGLIDGEGYIGIVDAGGYPQLRLKVAMADKGEPAVMRMLKLYGGNIYRAKARNDQSRPTITWLVTGRLAAEVIAKVHPHLAVKREIARLALDFWDLASAGSLRPNGQVEWTEQKRESSRVLKLRIQELNRTGPDPAARPLPNLPILATTRYGAWWEPNESLFGPVPFEGKFPISGMMIDGNIMALPAQNADGSSPGLPTPRVSDGNGPGHHGTGGPDLRTVVTTLS